MSKIFYRSCRELLASTPCFPVTGSCGERMFSKLKFASLNVLADTSCFACVGRPLRYTWPRLAQRAGAEKREAKEQGKPVPMMCSAHYKHCCMAAQAVAVLEVRSSA
jgi:hypothetical protein